jgi:hypothetical protein
MGLDLNLRRGENETEVSFAPRFSIAPDEQPVPAIGLESSSLKANSKDDHAQASELGHSFC